MGKFISNLFLGALAIGLSIFTGSRTLDLLAWALPANQVIYQWLGLCAFEGGMYFWSFYFVSGAKGTPQRSISIVMAVFSVVAVCVATVADLSLGASEAGKIAALPPATSQFLIVFLGVVVALNVAAFLACKLMSIDKLREAAEQNAEDMIHAAGLRAITSIAPHIASQAAPMLAQEWANRTWDRIVPGMGGHTQFIGQPAQAQPLALPAQAPAQAQPVQAQAQPAQAPAQAQPIVVSSQAPAKKGNGLGWFMNKLGGGKAQQAPAAFAQTATIPAQAPAQTQQSTGASQGNTGTPIAHPSRPAARPRRHSRPAHRKGGQAAQAGSFRTSSSSKP